MLSSHPGFRAQWSSLLRWLVAYCLGRGVSKFRMVVSAVAQRVSLPSRTTNTSAAATVSVRPDLTTRAALQSNGPRSPFLDNLVNCIKLCEAALGDQAVRGS
jgi:hypothetical protein